MKTSIIAFSATLLFGLSLGGCATNFVNWDAWKADKAGERYAAEVVTSEVKEGIIYGTAKVYCTGNIVDYVQKPYIQTTLPFSKGATIFVDKK
jgi:hypothetical protein